MSYTIQDIQINQRIVRIPSIIESSSIPQTPFEHTTFNFIREWLSGTEMFDLFTSGSTGNPKKITLARNQLKQSAMRTCKALGLAPHDTVLVCLDTKYIAGKMMLVRALENNMSIIAVDPDANPLQHVSTDTIIDFAAFVPMQLQEILKDKASRNQLGKIKSAIIGGAAVHASLEHELQKVHCALYATYGMTETVSHIALQRLNGNEKHNYFTVLPGIEIERDDRGCLVIEMPGMGKKIVTNDLVELIDQNNFRWLGRLDMVVNSGGVKISPEKIERVIDEFFTTMGITPSCFVAGIPDDRLGEKLILVMEGSAFPKEQEGLMLDYMKKSLHKYEVPKQLVYVPEFIRTETGKINRILTTKTIFPR